MSIFVVMFFPAGRDAVYCRGAASTFDGARAVIKRCRGGQETRLLPAIKDTLWAENGAPDGSHMIVHLVLDSGEPNIYMF